MRSAWVIDDEGQFWREGDATFSKQLRTNRFGPELTQFLVEQLGYVSVHQFPARLRLVFDASQVSPIALTGLIDWLAKRAFSPTTCEHPKNDRFATIFQDRSQLFGHISTIVETRMPRPDFSRQPILIERSVFATRWRAAQEILSEVHCATRRGKILDVLFQGHYSLATREENGELRTISLGSVHYKHDPAFAASLVNKTYRECYDLKYGHWIAETFKDLIRKEAPVTEAVDAMIEFPRHQRKRYFYERLALPLRTGAGDSCLLTAVALQ